MTTALKAINGGSKQRNERKLADADKSIGCDSFRDTVYYKRVIGDKLSRVV
jgi:hypothetical protein